jgi:hypothetical protein
MAPLFGTIRAESTIPGITATQRRDPKARR